MEDQNPFWMFDEYVEPKQAEKDALIEKLIAGDYRLSFSSMSAFAVSPRAFIAYKLQERKTTPAMILGEAVHCKVLEPDMFEKRYFIAPDVNGATVEGKQAWSDVFTDLTGDSFPVNKKGTPQIPKIGEIIEMIKGATGITVLPAKTNHDAEYRARMMIRNKACRSIIDMITQTEYDVEWEFCGIKFKGRIDGMSDTIICDIKNMPDATLHAASRAIHSRKLHWQAFCYSQAIGRRDCYILAVDGNGETSAHMFDNRHHKKAEIELAEYCRIFQETIAESIFDPTVWDMSQDFWLRNENNPTGINYL
jgi:hypothetical protein